MHFPAIALPPSGVDELKVLHLLPPDEQTGISQEGSSSFIDDELPCLRVNLDRSGQVEFLGLWIAGGVRPLPVGISVSAAEPGPRSQATTDPPIDVVLEELVLRPRCWVRPSDDLGDAPITA